MAVTPDAGATMTVIPWSLVKKLKLDLNAEDNDYNLITASGDRMTVLGTVVVYLHPTGSNTRPVYGIVTDDLGDHKVLLSYSDMRDWGMLSSDFPKVQPMKAKVNKVTTPRKNIRVPVANRHSPTKAPRKCSQAQPEQQQAKTKSITKEERDSIIECNDRVEDQKEAEKLRCYLNRDFPDVLK